MVLRSLFVCITASWGLACQSSPEVNFDLSQPVPDSFSEMSFFTLDGGVPNYSRRVIPYAVSTPLFSDYALKDRAIYIPEDVQAEWDGAELLQFPVGTVILKSFSFPADFRAPDEALRMIETRMMVRYDSGWKPYPYIWNEEQTDATLQMEGDVRNITFVDASGVEQTSTYLIPQKNQCFECHERKDELGGRFLTPIGTRPRYLNRPISWQGESWNQLELMVAESLLPGPVNVSPDDTATELTDFFAIENPSVEQVERAARDYLDMNCAHCHRPNGISGITSQLFLNYENQDLFHLGVCKLPGSAGQGTGGLSYDIVPGDPDDSILYFRTKTEEVGAMMPMIGRSLEHTKGAELVRQWIQNMPAESCKD